MDAFVYFPPGLDTPRDLIEDALEDALRGIGRVTGGGSGATGSNVDLSVDDKAPRDKVLSILREALTLVGVSRAKIVVDGVESRFP